MLTVLGTSAAWVLRAWKLHQLETMQLTKAQRELEIRNNDAVIQAGPPATETQSLGSYLLQGGWILSVDRV